MNGDREPQLGARLSLLERRHPETTGAYALSQLGVREPPLFVESRRVVARYAEQVIERRQLHAFMGDQEAQVFQVGIAIADHVNARILSFSDLISSKSS